MPFIELIVLNISTRKVRSVLTALAVAIAIMTVVAMGVLTESLKRTAVNILHTGNADFTVAQRGVSDVLYSSIDTEELTRLQSYPDVQRAVGVLVAPKDLDAQHPFFLRLGIQPQDLEPFGVQVLRGRAYTADAPNEIMLGYRAAQDFHKDVGDTFDMDTDDHYTIVGIYTTGTVYGDSASMLPLTTLQAAQRKPGNTTLAFVQIKPGANIDALRARIEKDMPELATVRTESEFGRIDRNLELISAANIGVTILALVVGAVGVMNTTLMSVFERTREFGVMRAVGWSRRRLLSLVWAEAFVISILGAMLGVALGMIAVRGIERIPELLGIFEPQYPASVFARALGIAVGMALIGAIYPAVRSALLVPLEALRHE